MKLPLLSRFLLGGRRQARPLPRLKDCTRVTRTLFQLSLPRRQPHSLCLSVRGEAVLLRQLQTGSVLTPALARHVCPGTYESAVCSVCALVTADLAHIMWGCERHSAVGSPKELPPDIIGLVSSPEYERQLLAVQRLEAALARQRRKGDPPSGGDSPSSLNRCPGIASGSA